MKVSLAARLHALERQRANAAAQNRQHEALIVAQVREVDRLTYLDERALGRGDHAQCLAVWATLDELPDWPVPSGEAEAWTWWEAVSILPVWADWPPPPSAAEAYFGAEITGLQATARERPDLTPQQARALAWALAEYRIALIYAEVLSVNHG